MEFQRTLATLFSSVASCIRSDSVPNMDMCTSLPVLKDVRRCTSHETCSADTFWT